MYYDTNLNEQFLSYSNFSKRIIIPEVHYGIYYIITDFSYRLPYLIYNEPI